MDDRRTLLALTFLGVIAVVALVGAIWLTSSGTDATVAWATVTGAMGTLAGILIPTRS